MVRDRWHSKSRLHSVRHFAYDEDRRRAYARDIPGHPVAPTNTAINIIRGPDQFPFVRVANRQFAAGPWEALELLP